MFQIEGENPFGVRGNLSAKGGPEVSINYIVCVQMPRGSGSSFGNAYRDRRAIAEIKSTSKRPGQRLYAAVASDVYFPRACRFKKTSRLAHKRSADSSPSPLARPGELDRFARATFGASVGKSLLYAPRIFRIEIEFPKFRERKSR